EAVEGAHPLRGVGVDGADVGPDLVLLGELTDGQVVGVDVIALRDRLGREPDDLPVAAHRLAVRARTPGDLVAGPDVAAEHDARGAILEDRAGRDRDLRDRHVVVGMEDDRLLTQVVGGHRQVLFRARGRPARRAGRSALTFANARSPFRYVSAPPGTRAASRAPRTSPRVAPCSRARRM